MKKLTLLGFAAILAIMMGIGIVYAQTAGPGMPGMADQGRGWGQGYGPQQQGGWGAPYNGAWQQDDRSRGSGMMGRGWGMGPGQRGYGRGMGSGMMGRFWDMFSGGGMGSGLGMGSGCR